MLLAVSIAIVFLPMGSLIAFMVLDLARIDRRKFPHSSADLCQTLLKSLQDKPEKWSGVSDNPITQAERGDFAYTIRQETGFELWIANGLPFFHVYEPKNLYIPLRYRIPMYR